MINTEPLGMQYQKEHGTYIFRLDYETVGGSDIPIYVDQMML
jgi:hypothetical protein